jgi:DNA modification methylase
VLTDPPYGIGLKYESYNDTENNWFELMDKVIPEITRISKMAILPSCQIKRLKWIYHKYPPDWLICWYKGSTGHASYIGFNDWEPHLVYGRRLNNLYMHDYFQTKSSPKKETFGHPCPKPEDWAEWIISRVARQDIITICDIFMGSGTTGVVCNKLKHNFIGIEIEPKYYEIAKRRIQNTQTDMFTELKKEGLL